MQWIKTEFNWPPTGMKVLCFKNGDCWTAYRFNYKKKNVWLGALPSCVLNPERQYRMGRCDEPDYWCEIPFDQLPGNYTGRMMLKAEGDEKLYTLDEFQVTYPKEHDSFVMDFIFALNQRDNKKNGKRKTQSS